VASSFLMRMSLPMALHRFSWLKSFYQYSKNVVVLVFLLPCFLGLEVKNFGFLMGWTFVLATLRKIVSLKV
jgi:hypothetical protein